MNSLFSNKDLAYTEGSGVGVLDLHLISSMINESILQSIFTGLLLILPVIWFWYMRNAIWRDFTIKTTYKILLCLPSFRLTFVFGI